MEKKFNVFRNLKLTEDGHSSLLKKIIHPRGSHGNENLNLKLFFEKVLKENFDESKEWEVETNIRTGKKSFSDLVIFSKDKKLIYAIENKVKGAEDMPNQLYRYWYGLKYGNEYSQLENVGDVKIYYLSLNKNKKYDNQSIEMPTNNTYVEREQALIGKGISLPKLLTDETEVNHITYSDEIAAFLEALIPQCNGSDCRFKMTLEQYLEWIIGKK